ncbi:MAG: outer membrane protein transport protein [Spirochaetes bacterium]|nr:outer membrane protein transport protein [Spirochaetota bacterium]
MLQKITATLVVIFIYSNGFCFLENYNNYQHLIGERAAGLGGAYCALANDGAALWYNPAGLANIIDSKLNLSVNTYSYLTRNSPQYWQIEEQAGKYQSLDLKETDISVIPTSVAYARRVNWIGNDVIAYGLFVPMQDAIQATIAGRATGSVMNVDLNATYRINTKAYYGIAGYGLKISNNLNAGLTAALGYFQGKGGANISAYLDPGGTNQSEIAMIIDNELTAMTSFGGVGMQYLLTPHHHLGAYYRSPVYRVYASRKEKMTTQQVGPIFPSNSSESTTVEDNFRFKIVPAYISLGYGYTREGKWSFTCEGIMHYTNPDYPKKVLNGKVGLEIYIHDDVIVRTGFFTDFSQKNTVTQTSENDEKNDYYGATLSFSFGNDLNPLQNDTIKAKSMWTTIGVSYQLGIGDIRGFRFYTVSSGSDPIVHHYTHRISIYIGESIAF